MEPSKVDARWVFRIVCCILQGKHTCSYAHAVAAGRRNHRRGQGPHCLKVVCEMTDKATGKVVGDVAAYDTIPEPELSSAVWRACELNRSSQSKCSPPRMYCVNKGQRACRGEIVFSLEKTSILLRSGR